MAHVVIAGASGLIGQAAAAELVRQGIGVRRLVRRRSAHHDESTWDPHSGAIDPAVLAGADAVFNFSGRRIAPGRWTPAARREIIDSRVLTNRLLADAMANLAPAARPPVFITASAIGIYGDRGDDALTESSSPGQGFMSEVVQAWEGEALRAPGGVRVVCARFGLILTRRGGFLAPILPLFRLGLGGPLGSGRQWWSWVHLDDVLAALAFSMRTSALQGPVNVVSPRPVTNREFTRVLASVLRRPAIVPVPALALRIALGRQEADEAVLSSQRVIPARLNEQGFTFRWTDLHQALQDLVGPGA